MTPECRSVTLRDGRRLAYAEWGDLTGRPVIHQHGMPGSRLEHEAEAEVYRALGVRVITPDRPGYGRSDPSPGRTLAGWAADVEQLADHLELASFGVTALSGGGIFALALAACLPGRVGRVVVTGCPAPMTWSGAYDGMRTLNRVGLWLALRRPRALSLAIRVVAWFAWWLPDLIVAQFNRDKPVPDRRLLAISRVRHGAAETLKEAVRGGGQGYAEDIGLMARPWAFELDDITVPIELWHGDLDTVIPIQHAFYLAARIRGARLRICPGEAHMLMWDHLPEILLAASASDQPAFERDRTA